MDCNLATAATTPFRAGPEHSRMLRLTGRWSGQTKTMFEPGTAPVLSDIRASVEALLGGRFLRIDYVSAINAEPHAGEFLIGFDPSVNHYSAFWIDSIHTGIVPMVCSGSPTTDGGISITGSYAAGPDRWGWRTMFRLDDSECLHIHAYNISPDGQEHPALETRLTRVSGT
jgi:hypothetical protein